jgi:hypothetical protein
LFSVTFRVESRLRVAQEKGGDGIMRLSKNG